MINKLPIWGFLGPEGGGKSIGMAWAALRHYDPRAFGVEAEGGPLFTFPGFEVKNPHTGEVISKEVGVEDWATAPEQLRNGFLCIDEIQNWLDAMAHNSRMSRMFGYLGMQRRKFSFGMGYTVQNFGWLNDRVRWLTHLLTFCRDAAFTAEGQERGLDFGKVIYLETYDVKGFLTGQEWSPLGVKKLYAEPYWNAYDSFTPTSLMASWSHKIDIKQATTVLRAPGAPEAESDLVIPSKELITAEKAYHIQEVLEQAGVKPGQMLRAQGQILRIAKT